jgi:hypothetical protein
MKLSRLTEKGMISFAAQRLCTWYPLRQAISSLLASMKPQQKSPALKETKAIVDQLRESGIFMMPQFVDEKAVENIKRHCEGQLVHERYGEKRSFGLDSVPEGVHVGHYNADQFLDCDEVISIINNPLLLGVATDYLGCVPTISALTLWWSFPTGGKPKEAENYHRDVDDWKFVKFFVYLTDVDSESGPHKFVRRSNKSWKFLLNRRFTDKEVESQFAKDDCLTITGKAGDAFFEDTFGLHKGQPPASHRRLVLQLEYSINPIAAYSYKPQRLRVGDSLTEPYAARMYLREATS